MLTRSSDLIKDRGIVATLTYNDRLPKPSWASDEVCPNTGIPRGVLYQGEALDLLSKIPAESVDCVWTDPPYMLSNGGITCVAGRMVSVDKGESTRAKAWKPITNSICNGPTNVTVS